MAEEAQLSIFIQLLRRFEREGVLNQIMLIGSWCLFFYRSVLSEGRSLPAMRTLDADFLIPTQRTIRREVNVPLLLKEMGFVPTFYPSSNWIVYDHPELRVEFLIPELGKGHDKAQEVKKLHVRAQRLRFLNLLAEYPRKLSYEGFSIDVPEPAAFALHKLIVSARRTTEVKRQKDLETALALFDYIYLHPKELDKMKEIVKRFPKGWLKRIDDLAKKYEPRLTEMIRDL